MPTNFSTETPREAMVIVCACLAGKAGKIGQAIRVVFLGRLRAVADVVF